MPSPSVPSTWPTRPIVSAVLCGSSAWHQGPKATGRVGSVRSAVSCLRLLLLRDSPSFLDRCGGSMWQAGPFAAPGPPTGVGNMWRCFHWLDPSRRPSLLLVHPVPCVRIIAAVGRIGSHATLGGDRRTCGLPSLVFPIFWRATNQGGTGQHRSYFKTVPSPSECIRRAKNPCLLPAPSLSSPAADWRCGTTSTSCRSHRCHEEPARATSLEKCSSLHIPWVSDRWWQTSGQLSKLVKRTLFIFPFSCVSFPSHMLFPLIFLLSRLHPLEHQIPYSAVSSCGQVCPTKHLCLYTTIGMVSACSGRKGCWCS